MSNVISPLLASDETIHSFQSNKILIDDSDKRERMGMEK